MLERRKIPTWLIVIVIAVMFAVGCIYIAIIEDNNSDITTTTKNYIGVDNKECKFVTVQTYANYEIVYNEANLVMYIIGESGSATVMVDDNNKPMIWRGRYQW